MGNSNSHTMRLGGCSAALTASSPHRNSQQMQGTVGQHAEHELCHLANLFLVWDSPFAVFSPYTVKLAKTCGNPCLLSWPCWQQSIVPLMGIKSRLGFCFNTTQEISVQSPNKMKCFPVPDMEWAAVFAFIAPKSS